MTAAQIKKMKPVSFTFKNKAQTEVKKYFDLTPFCAA